MDKNLILTQIDKEELNQLIQAAVKDALKQTESQEQPKSDILSVRQVCQLLNLTPATIYNLVCQRKIPNSKVGKRLFFNRSELMEWIKSGKRNIRQND